MGKTLAVFSFEGMLLNYPVSKEEIREWLDSPYTLEYPYVPDIPGPNAWDNIALSFLKRFMNRGSDMLFVSDIAGEDLKTDKKIQSLLKSKKVEDSVVFRNQSGKDFYQFIWKELRYYLQSHQSLKSKYERVELLLSDVELSKKIAEDIINNYNITSVVHDLNPSYD